MQELHECPQGTVVYLTTCCTYEGLDCCQEVPVYCPGSTFIEQGESSIPIESDDGVPTNEYQSF